MLGISRRLLAAAVMSAAVAAAVLAGSGVAGASTGTAEISPEQAGYTATGAQFKYIDALVYLRNPGQYASEVASFGDSVQLWSAGLVVTLGVTASTSGSGYTQYATIYDRSTHTVIASNPNAEFCDSNENVCNLPPQPFDAGTQLDLSISYSPADGSLEMIEVFSGGFSFVSSYTVTGQSFTQARIGTDFGNSPWDGSYSHRPPANQVKVAAYSTVHADHVQRPHFVAVVVVGAPPTAGQHRATVGQRLGGRPDQPVLVRLELLDLLRAAERAGPEPARRALSRPAHRRHHRGTGARRHIVGPARQDERSIRDAPRLVRRTGA